MKLIDQGYKILAWPDSPTSIIEQAGRTCYKSEDKITIDSADKFARMVRDRNHESVIDHAQATVKFITNRGVTHELVRHRLASYSQESTRYVRYDGFMEFIRPVWVTDELLELVDTGGGKDLKPGDADRITAFFTFRDACMYAEDMYQELLEYNWRPEQAREVLPNALKTEIVVTANFREWRHIFKLRTGKKAHPQIRELMKPCLAHFKELCPAVFEDI